MIPMSCPSCGRRGNIPLDRLNTRMHCKKCDAVFHLDATGKPVMGEPKSSKANKSGRAGAHAPSDQFDPIGIIASKLAKIPKPIWMTLAGLLGIFLLYSMASIFQSLPKSTEQSFAAKNVLIATAFLDRDLSTMKKYSTTDCYEELASLIETFRPLIGDKAGKGSEGIGTVVSAPEILTDSPRAEVAIVPPPEADGKAPPIFNLDLVWQKTNEKYYLNGKATLATNIEREKLRKEAEASRGKRK
jgi:hypothetical protein